MSTGRRFPGANSMMRSAARVLVVVLLGAPAVARAHPAPFSYLDLQVEPTSVKITAVVHVFDVAHELGVQPPDSLFDPQVVAIHAAAIGRLLDTRLRLETGGRHLAARAWSHPVPMPERQSLRISGEFPADRPIGRLAVQGVLFPYDPQHQTFVNLYEGGALVSQTILGEGAGTLEHFPGTRQGLLAVIGRFVPAGIHHILIGPDHLLFLVGLLLLGGSLKRLALVVTAFTVAHSVTLSLAVLDLVDPPARLVEPAIALSIVYVGADNLTVRGGRDVRPWIALLFGLVHGFGFAGVLSDMGLPSQALGWSLFAFNLGVEVGQLAVVVAVASALLLLRARSEAAGRRLSVAGSVFVIAAGTFWFIERVFLRGGPT